MENAINAKSNGTSKESDDGLLHQQIEMKPNYVTREEVSNPEPMSTKTISGQTSDPRFNDNTYSVVGCIWKILVHLWILYAVIMSTYLFITQWQTDNNCDCNDITTKPQTQSQAFLESTPEPNISPTSIPSLYVTLYEASDFSFGLYNIQRTERVWKM